MNIISLFAGAGGLDLGFSKAGYNIIWANEYDKDIWKTYKKNHPKTFLDTRSITEINTTEIPDCEGIIGGPPCQSWSEAGALRGINDSRGKLFFDFIRILEAKQPKFFLAENVGGMLLPRNKDALKNIKDMFSKAGYNLSVELLNTADYLVPQDRKRIIFIGIRKDLNFKFEFSKKAFPKISLKDAIFDLKDNAVPAINTSKTNYLECQIDNHEYLTGGFSTIYMSRNRVRSWEEQSFTIQAGGRHAPLHPQAPKMTFISQNVREFKKGYEHLYRRLTVRECARIQTFPDDFKLYYDNVYAGYKMIGNAVPVNFANFLAVEIKKQVAKTQNIKQTENDKYIKGSIKYLATEELYA